MTLYSTVEEKVPTGGKGKIFFSLQPADFSCSCYALSFQKYEGLWKINKPMIATVTRNQGQEDHEEDTGGMGER